MTTSTNNFEIIPEDILSDALFQFSMFQDLHYMKPKADPLNVKIYQVTRNKRQTTIHSR